MKRFHIHMAVENIDRNVKFYSTLFGDGATATQSGADVKAARCAPAAR